MRHLSANASHLQLFNPFPLDIVGYNSPPLKKEETGEPVKLDKTSSSPRFTSCEKSE